MHSLLQISGQTIYKDVIFSQTPMIAAIDRWSQEHSISLAPRIVRLVENDVIVFHDLVPCSADILKELIHAYVRYNQPLVPLSCENRGRHEEFYGLLWTTGDMLGEKLPKICTKGNERVSLYISQRGSALRTYFGNGKEVMQALRTHFLPQN